jgi:hypothetical protein
MMHPPLHHQTNKKEMKTTFTHNQKSIKMVLMFSIVIAGILFTEFAQAQRPPKGYSMANYHRGNSGGFVLGIEGGASMRTFTIKSDIDAINQLYVIQEGWSGGVVIGGGSLRGKLLYGNYSISSTLSKDISEKSFSAQLQFYPLSTLGVKSKYFQPYLIGGIDISNIIFKGTYIPAPKLMQEEKKPCPCDCDGSSGLPGDPDMGSGMAGSSSSPADPGGDPDVLPPPDTRTDRLLATQAIAGLGLECNFKSNGRMVTIFSEARYGKPLGVEPITTPLANTSISGQFIVYFGISIGISN